MKANLIEMLKAQGFSEVESKSETIQQCNGVILQRDWSREVEVAFHGSYLETFAVLWLFSIGKKTAIGRRGCLFMPPDAKGPHGAALGPAGANAKRPPRAWESPKREGAFAQIFLA